ncbi:hypothetical protein [Ralstonia phage RSS30]|uniref:Uncharacterized protein n=4 Tax=Restivirus RSS1 TaxID=2011075 RepID=A0A0K2QQ04_9VIRU|nr:hypothetical protein QLX28_gp06 [Ralstonia phage RSS0]YP_008320199.1 hypothetical protein [Ralstonia phage RSS30]YP_008320411.1 hypothetical protein [Ralstonia phage RSS20]YP_010083986.1 hypothetical protein KMD53_gp06 [Ralstonia phage RSS-TH1]YP_010083998.1 hypothetical protein KMD54_gp06 [Ralstonia phage RS611]YP_863926.1 hypothetical ptoein [Ralstonia phage RSS1]AFC62048.1 hypothetical protein RSS0_0006 [Ralstonia phage RSS0]BAF36527.1 hypothetical ptoein [Ralstonia phage RSS1]BAN6263
MLAIDFWLWAGFLLPVLPAVIIFRGL